MFRTILLLTKGFVRDPTARRKLMFWIMLAALLMLGFGTFFITDQWMREHVWWGIGYWAVCGWLTLTAMLLAVMDILILRATQRALRRALEKKLRESEKE